MPRLTDRSISRFVTGKVEFKYLCYEPTRSSESPPLLVFLHGAGQKGTSLEQLRGASLPSLVEDGLDLPATVVAPLAGPGPGWPVQRVAEFIHEVRRIHSADPRRIYLTGESMGGRGVWEIAYWHPSLLAALVPVCGFGIPNLAPVLKDMPVWMFHGTDDEILPVARSDEMSAALEAVGAPYRYSRLAGRPHSIGREVYQNSELWDWLFAQSRNAGEAEPESLRS